MDGVGVSQQMQVRFEMSMASGPGGFSVCVPGSEGGERAWEGWGGVGGSRRGPGA